MISAIVLSAGNSTRMGSVNKMLLPFGDSTVIGSVVFNLTNSIIDEIIIVENTDKKISNHLFANTNVRFVTNENTSNGLTSSIQQGVRATSRSTDGYLICLGDMPFITKKEYNSLAICSINKKSKSILLPIFEGKRGNPVMFSAHFKSDILDLKAENGCKPLVKANQAYITEVPFSTNHCLLDIDTIEDYKRLTS